LFLSSLAVIILLSNPFYLPFHCPLSSIPTNSAGGPPSEEVPFDKWKQVCRKTVESNVLGRPITDKNLI